MNDHHIDQVVQDRILPLAIAELSPIKQSQSYQSPFQSLHMSNKTKEPTKQQASESEEPSDSGTAEDSSENSFPDDDLIFPPEPSNTKGLPLDHPFGANRTLFHSSIPKPTTDPFELTSRYTNPTTKNIRLPNIDVNNVRVPLPSWSKAKKLLAILSNADLENADLPELVTSCGLEFTPSPHQRDYSSWWVAFQIGDMIHPQWWLKRGKPVPTYDQLIVSAGPTDIGVHIDTYGPKLKPVDTYITILHGKKMVAMVPPSPAGDLFYKKYEDTIFPQRKKDNERFNEFIEEVKELKGYYFALECENDISMTILIPKGWYHWVLNVSVWSVLLSASQF